jgi:hypothetical protein
MPAAAIGLAVLTSYAIGRSSVFEDGGAYATAIAVAAALAFSDFTATFADLGDGFASLARRQVAGSAGFVGLLLAFAIAAYPMASGASARPPLSAAASSSTQSLVIDFVAILVAGILVARGWAQNAKARSARPLVGSLASDALVPPTLAFAGELLLGRAAEGLLLVMALASTALGIVLGFSGSVRAADVAAEDKGEMLILASVVLGIMPWIA